MPLFTPCHSALHHVALHRICECHGCAAARTIHTAACRRSSDCSLLTLVIEPVPRARHRREVEVAWATNHRIVCACRLQDHYWIARHRLFALPQWVARSAEGVCDADLCL